MAQERDVYTHRLKPASRNVAQPFQKVDELTRVTTTNQNAMAAASTRTYGHMQSSKKKARIDMWVERLPYHWQLEDTATSRSITVAVYMDWLNWARFDALSWVSKLDEFEGRYRAVGVEYHKIPHSLRHSETLLHGPKIGKPIIARLSQIFETDRPRDQQTFFKQWMRIFNVATEIMDKVDECGNTDESPDKLGRLCKENTAAFRKLWKSLYNLEDALEWVRDAVTDLAERSDLDGIEPLEVKHSREGGLFRRWVQTFPEISHELVKSKHEYIEYWVHKVLSDGVEEDDYWTMLAQGGPETGNEMME